MRTNRISFIVWILAIVGSIVFFFLPKEIGANERAQIYSGQTVETNVTLNVLSTNKTNLTVFSKGEVVSSKEIVYIDKAGVYKIESSNLFTTLGLHHTDAGRVRVYWQSWQDVNLVSVVGNMFFVPWLMIFLGGILFVVPMGKDTYGLAVLIFCRKWLDKQDLAGAIAAEIGSPFLSMSWACLFAAVMMIILVIHSMIF